MFGSPRTNELFTESGRGIPLITDCFDSLEKLDEFNEYIGYNNILYYGTE
ncbi:hypothetical protein ZWY2020_026457 [Hordeum vulgare]|nr:hypothetical protein ZWY2020_026457 [Hordeum vulgare]